MSKRWGSVYGPVSFCYAEAKEAAGDLGAAITYYLQSLQAKNKPTLEESKRKLDAMAKNNSCPVQQDAKKALANYHIDFASKASSAEMKANRIAQALDYDRDRAIKLLTGMRSISANTHIFDFYKSKLLQKNVSHIDIDEAIAFAEDINGLKHALTLCANKNEDGVLILYVTLNVKNQKVLKGLLKAASAKNRPQADEVIAYFEKRMQSKDTQIIATDEFLRMQSTTQLWKIH